MMSAVLRRETSRSVAADPIPASPLASGAHDAPCIERRHPAYRILLWLLVAAYSSNFGVLALKRHDALATTIFDLGIFDQATWEISRGYPTFLTTRGMFLLQDHFSPILYLVAPLYWVRSDPRTLLIFQVVVLALGAIPLYSITERRLQSQFLALLVSLAYLLYPALHWMNLFDFHPECLAPLLILSTLWHMQCRKWAPYFLCIALLLLCKETFGLTVLSIGIYVALSLDRRVGIATVLTGSAGMGLALFTMRLLNHGQPSQYISFYAAYGHSLPAVARFLIMHPGLLWNVICSDESLNYLTNLLAPVAFLAFVAPEALALAIPTLLSNVLASRPAMRTILFQYNATIIPIVFFSTAEGLYFGSRMLGRYAVGHQRRVQQGLALLLTCGICYGVWQGPLPQQISHTYEPGIAPTRASAVRKMLAIIPSDASVSAQTAAGAQLTHRQHLYMFPNPFQMAAWGNSSQALEQQEGRGFQPLSETLLHQRLQQHLCDYIVLGPTGSSQFPLPPPVYDPLVQVVLSDKSYGVIQAANGTIILKYGSDHVRGKKLLKQAMASEKVPLPGAPNS